MIESINLAKIKIILMSFILLVFMAKLYSFIYNYTKDKLEIKK